jgi:hypothetical protein
MAQQIRCSKKKAKPIRTVDPINYIAKVHEPLLLEVFPSDFSLLSKCSNRLWIGWSPRCYVWELLQPVRLSSGQCTQVLEDIKFWIFMDINTQNININQFTCQVESLHPGPGPLMDWIWLGILGWMLPNWPWTNQHSNTQRVPNPTSVGLPSSLSPFLPYCIFTHSHWYSTFWILPLTFPRDISKFFSPYKRCQSSVQKSWIFQTLILNLADLNSWSV